MPKTKRHTKSIMKFSLQSSIWVLATQGQTYVLFVKKKKSDIQNNINKDVNELALNLHKMRAKRFYELLRESQNDLKIISVF